MSVRPAGLGTLTPTKVCASNGAYRALRVLMTDKHASNGSRSFVQKIQEI